MYNFQNPTRAEEILEYIGLNEGTTEYMIAKKMIEKNVCARDTTHNILYNQLIPSRKVLDRKKGNGFHKFYLNFENEFNKLSKHAALLIKSIGDFNNLVL